MTTKTFSPEGRVNMLDEYDVREVATAMGTLIPGHMIKALYRPSKDFPLWELEVDTGEGKPDTMFFSSNVGVVIQTKRLSIDKDEEIPEEE